MASVAALRRIVADESLPLDRNGEGWEMNGRREKKSRPWINRFCVLGMITFTALALLLARVAFSFIALGYADITQFEHESTLSGFARRAGMNDSSSSSSSSSSFQSRPGKLLTFEGDLDRSGGAGLGRHRENEPLLASETFPRPTKPRNYLTKSQRDSKGSRCIPDSGIESALGIVSLAYHNPRLFYEDMHEMACNFKIFVYPSARKGPLEDIFLPYETDPSGNYASEHYFKKALLNSSFVTTDPSEADLFYLPFSIALMRTHPLVGVKGIKSFIKDYVAGIRKDYPYWNRTDGADHFYVNCHSIGRGATDEAQYIRLNAIQVVCSSSYFVSTYFPHKDTCIPQVWPRSGFPKEAASIKQRKTLAFFAGAANSPVRAEVAKHWANDSEIRVYTQRIDTPYSEALLTSKFCLHVKGFEVNTARLADAMYYGCVPIIVADHHDLPYNDVLDWSQFALVVTTLDIPSMKKIIKEVTPLQYAQMQSNVMQVRRHFEWHAPARPYDAFYMVMYELWLRRHVARYTLDS